MKLITCAAALGAAMLIGCGLLAPPAQAGYIVTLTQVGGNVVASGSGAIDLTGLTFGRTGSGDLPGVVPNTGGIITGPASHPTAALYSGPTTGPTNFGSGGLTLASSGSGDLVGINQFFGATLFELPSGYASDTALSDTATYSGKTFATLGATPGTYVWTWGSGLNQNFTVQIGPAAVPEPSAFALLALPLGLVMLAAARRRA